MIQKEMRLKRISNFNEKLSKIFESMTIGDRTIFLINNGAACRLDHIGGEYNALVVEYAESVEMAKNDIFGEDGDLFFMNELSEEEMLNNIIAEINDAF